MDTSKLGFVSHYHVEQYVYDNFVATGEQMYNATRPHIKTDDYNLQGVVYVCRFIYKNKMHVYVGSTKKRGNIQQSLDTRFRSR
jgi:hypothetical protein